MKNLATSIKDRLLNLSRSQGGDFQRLLERFAMGAAALEAGSL